MINPRSLRRHRRIYRSLLLFYPPSFRREYGNLMTQSFCDNLRDRGGPRTWLLVGPDVLHSVPQQIMEMTFMNQKWMGAITFLASITLIALLAVGAGPPIMLLGAVLLTVSLFAFTTTKRSGRPTEYLYGGTAPKAWTWWTVPAALFAALYVIAAVGQLIDVPKATNVGALAIMTAFAGLIVSGLWLRSRSRVSGNWMIVFAMIPALMFFWIVWPTVVALVVIAGAVGEVAKAAPRTPLAT